MGKVYQLNSYNWFFHVIIVICNVYSRLRSDADEGARDVSTIMGGQTKRISPPRDFLKKI